jgi:hypothetical protein
MLRASLIGLATVAALAAGASSASAGGLDVDVNFGLGGYGYHHYPVYSPYPVYYDDYDDDCHWIKTKKWVKKNGHWKKIFIKKLVCY